MLRSANALFTQNEFSRHNQNYMLAKLKSAYQGMVEKQRVNAQTRTLVSSYKDSLVRMLSDMNLSPNEVHLLQAQRQNGGLDASTIRRTHVQVYTDVVNHVCADGVITEQELEAVAQIGTALGLEWKDLPPRQLQLIQIAASIVNIQRGLLPEMVPGSFGLKTNAGEVVHAEIACRLLDDRTYRQYIGASSGMSFRIAKGVYYHVGSTRGRSIPVTETVPVDAGVLTITNQRLAFVGQKQSVNAEWKKVLSVEPMSDGVLLAFTHRKKTLLLKYMEGYYAEVIAALIGYYMR